MLSQPPSEPSLPSDVAVEDEVAQSLHDTYFQLPSDVEDTGDVDEIIGIELPSDVDEGIGIELLGDVEEGIGIELPGDVADDVIDSASNAFGEACRLSDNDVSASRIG